MTGAVIGEIHTGLVQHSGPVPQRWLSGLPRSGAAGVVTQRFAEVFGGGSPATVRSLITAGGRLAQGSVLRPAGAREQTPGGPFPTDVELARLAARALDLAQARSPGDRRPPTRAARSRVRWVLLPGAGDDVLTCGGGADGGTITLVTAGEQAELIPFFEYAALHHWLLTTVRAAWDRADAGLVDRRRVVARLAPLADQLLCRWEPGGLAEPALARWRHLDRMAGLTVQWTACAALIRDQIALAALGWSPIDGALGEASRGRPAGSWRA
ncbi:hypothetical protein [Micromonospora tulbaghiae]|uniref:hypothetical protein n=1 Tax=Micromonospora tulbaghiae TaxID=479978 RepID=UPI003677C9B8